MTATCCTSNVVLAVNPFVRLCFLLIIVAGDPAGDESAKEANGVADEEEAIDACKSVKANSVSLDEGGNNEEEPGAHIGDGATKKKSSSKLIKTKADHL